MTDDQLTRMTNAAGNVQNDGLTLQIAAKRGDSMDELRRLFDVVKDSWERLAEVWQEIDGAPDLDQPLTLDWLREHVPGEWVRDEREDEVMVWSATFDDSYVKFVVDRAGATLSAGWRSRLFSVDDSPCITIANAIGLLKLAGVQLKGVE